MVSSSDLVTLRPEAVSGICAFLHKLQVFFSSSFDLRDYLETYMGR